MKSLNTYKKLKEELISLTNVVASSNTTTEKKDIDIYTLPSIGVLTNEKSKYILLYFYSNIVNRFILWIVTETVVGRERSSSEELQDQFDEEGDPNLYYNNSIDSSMPNENTIISNIGNDLKNFKSTDEKIKSLQVNKF